MDRMQIAHFSAIILTALALIPGGAHVRELPAKIDMDMEHYLTVQSIYRGWACRASSSWRQSPPMCGRPCWRAAGLSPRCWRWPRLGTTLIVFFSWIYPVNQLTLNWSVIADDWEMLRARWEYSHAASAALTFLAFCACTASAIADPGAQAPGR